jgi:hypothetical protein
MSYVMRIYVASAIYGAVLYALGCMVYSKRLSDGPMLVILGCATTTIFLLLITVDILPIVACIPIVVSGTLVAGFIFKNVSRLQSSLKQRWIK